VYDDLSDRFEHQCERYTNDKTDIDLETCMCDTDLCNGAVGRHVDVNVIIALVVFAVIRMDMF